MLSTNGNQLAFASELDLIPGQNPDLNREIFVYEESTGLTRVTDTAGIVNKLPVLSRDGGCVVSPSSADLVPGGNTEVFLSACGPVRDGFMTGDTRHWTSQTSGDRE